MKVIVSASIESGLFSQFENVRMRVGVGRSELIASWMERYVAFANEAITVSCACGVAEYAVILGACPECKAAPDERRVVRRRIDEGGMP